MTPGPLERSTRWRVNTFAQDTAGVLEAVRAARALTAARGDDPPIWITELGWATGGRPSAFRVSEARQARLVDDPRGSPRGARTARGDFNWKDSLPYRDGRDFFGLHTGLIRRDRSAKPALSSFSRASDRSGQ